MKIDLRFFLTESEWAVVDRALGKKCARTGICHGRRCRLDRISRRLQ